MKRLKIVGIGEIVWDEFNGVFVLGGAPLNFAHFARQLGAKTYIIAAIGKDELGDKVLKKISELDVDQSGIQRNDLPTGVVHAEQIPGSDDVVYDIYENVAWDALEFDPRYEALLQDADAICWGSLAQRTAAAHSHIMKILDCVPSACMKVFDINLRQHYYSREVIEKSLEKANVLKLNEGEVMKIAELLEMPDPDAPLNTIMALIDKYDLKYVVYTLGSSRSEIYSADGLLSMIPTPKVENFVDAVGAGDSFTASFVTSMLQGKDVRLSHKIAVEVAAFVCTQKGAINPIPDSLLDNLNL